MPWNLEPTWKGSNLKPLEHYSISNSWNPKNDCVGRWFPFSNRWTSQVSMLKLPGCGLVKRITNRMNPRPRALGHCGCCLVCHLKYLGLSVENWEAKKSKGKNSESKDLAGELRVLQLCNIHFCFILLDALFIQLAYSLFSSQLEIWRFFKKRRVSFSWKTEDHPAPPAG